MSITLSALQKQRRDTAANWTAENPTLLAGEIGLESDTGYWKVGDGATAWTSLAYVSGLGAEIPVDRLADGAARQLLQTDAAGTGVEWTDDIDVPGTLDVTGAATFDDDVTIQGDLTVNGTTTTIDTTTLVVEDKNIEIGKVATPTDVTADGGGITLKGDTDKTINWVDATDAWTLSEHVDIASAKEYRIAGTKVLDATSLGSSVLITSANITDGTIVDGDVNASAAIAGTKISPDFGSQNVTTTGTTTAAALIPSGSSVPTNGVYLPSANNVAISTNGTGRLFVDSSGNVGVGGATSSNILECRSSTNSTIGITRTASHNVTLNAIAGGHFTIGLDGSGGGTERLRIDSSGRLGLGTSTFGNADADDLTVAGSGNTGITIRSGTTSAANLYFADGTTGDDAVRGYLAYNHSADRLTLGTNAATAVTIDSSQRVGIGVTSPQFTNHIKQNTTYGFGVEATSDDSRFLIGNVSSTWRVAATYGSTGSFQPITFYTSDLERCRLDTSGRLLVGTSSSSDSARLVVQGYSADSTGASILVMKRGSAASSLNSAGYDIGLLDFMSSDSGLGARIKAVSDGVWSSTSDCPTRLEFSVTRDGQASPTEAARINSNGAFSTFSANGWEALMGCTADSAGTANTVIIGRHSATGTFSGTTSFLVFTNGNVQNTNNSYGQISDIKLKENIVDANSQWNDIKAVRVRNFNFKHGQTHRQIGVVAQEVEQVSPGLVYETPERDQDGNETGEVTKGVNYSILYMKAVKALQEAMERIEVLEAKVNALEGN